MGLSLKITPQESSLIILLMDSLHQARFERSRKDGDYSFTADLLEECAKNYFLSLYSLQKLIKS